MQTGSKSIYVGVFHFDLSHVVRTCRRIEVAATSGMANWSDSEVIMLIQLWREEGVQEQLKGAKRKKHVYEKIVKEMQKKGCDKTAEQCRMMKKLKLEYRKVKDKHSKTGQGRNSWKFLQQMDAVLGHRPATRPAVSLDTSANQNEEDEVEGDEEEEEEQGEVSLQENTSSITLEDSGAESQINPSET